MKIVKNAFLSKIALPSTVGLSILMLAGCSSINEAIRANINPVNGEPVYQVSAKTPALRLSSVEIRAQQIFKSSDRELQDLLVYADDHPEVFDHLKIQKVGLTTEIVFVSSKKGFFPSGVYKLSQIAQTEDRSGVVFADLVATAASKVLDAVKDQAGQIVIEATYSASADGQPIRTIRYMGEFGAAIKLPLEITTLNKKPVTIVIKKGQRINNEQLAALRAFSLATVFHGKLKAYNISDKFDLVTSDATGIQHRWVELSIKISPAQ